MTIRLAKLYVSLILCCVACYLFWTGVLSAAKTPLSAGVTLVTSLICLGSGGMLGWKTILEELAVTSD